MTNFALGRPLAEPADAARCQADADLPIITPDHPAYQPLVQWVADLTVHLIRRGVLSSGPDAEAAR